MTFWNDYISKTMLIRWGLTHAISMLFINTDHMVDGSQMQLNTRRFRGCNFSINNEIAINYSPVYYYLRIGWHSLSQFGAATGSSVTPASCVKIPNAKISTIRLTITLAVLSMKTVLHQLLHTVKKSFSRQENIHRKVITHCSFLSNANWLNIVIYEDGINGYQDQWTLR